MMKPEIWASPAPNGVSDVLRGLIREDVDADVRLMEAGIPAVPSRSPISLFRSIQGRITTYPESRQRLENVSTILLSGHRDSDTECSDPVIPRRASPLTGDTSAICLTVRRW